MLFRRLCTASRIFVDLEMDVGSLYKGRLCAEDCSMNRLTRMLYDWISFVDLTRSSHSLATSLS